MIRCLIVVACVLASSLADNAPCFNGQRRVCPTCDDPRNLDKATCMGIGGTGSWDVCNMANSICWESVAANGKYTSSCKPFNQCTDGPDGNGNVVTCHGGITKECDHATAPSDPNFQFCEGEKTFCEWKQGRFVWDRTCPEGEILRKEAMYGRLPGDDKTCIEGVAGSLISDNCPGKSSAEMVNILQQKCDTRTNHLGCMMKARNSETGGDPCSGTFKYLKVCSKCVPVDPCSCTVTGDPAVQTTDGNWGLIDAPGTFVLLKSDKPGCIFTVSLTVQTETVNGADKNIQKSVSITLNGVSYVIDDGGVQGPSGDGITKGRSGDVSSFSAEGCGVEVTFTGSGLEAVAQARVLDKEVYGGYLSGMCGNCNGNRNDDIRMRNGNDIGPRPAGFAGWNADWST